MKAPNHGLFHLLPPDRQLENTLWERELPDLFISRLYPIFSLSFDHLTRFFHHYVTHHVLPFPVYC